ncbi:hypothetical protein STRTUCAR8_00547, partial [Streptomyces turgidiscabies Car8]
MVTGIDGGRPALPAPEADRSSHHRIRSFPLPPDRRTTGTSSPVGSSRLPTACVTPERIRVLGEPSMPRQGRV